MKASSKDKDYLVRFNAILMILLSKIMKDLLGLDCSLYAHSEILIRLGKYSLGLISMNHLLLRAKINQAA